ncbi:MAG TPA: hypothetical protein VHN15_13305 [Thermoanaerobaculia bacterium]|nr:hypothetical protein [Thermoanaerobaculia bacterium]
MPTFRILFATLLLTLLLVSGPAAVWAQARPGTPTISAEPMVVQSYTLKHKPAIEAWRLVYPLLSRQGVLELQAGGNTLVVRDGQAVVDKVIQRLREFDSPPRAMRIEVLIVKASRATVSPPIQHSDLPEELTARLRGVLAYEIFELQAKAYLSAQEAQSVAYSMGTDYEVRFRLGLLGTQGQLPMKQFRLSRHKAGGANGAPLTWTSRPYDMELWLGQPQVLLVTRDKDSPEALMVVLTPRRGAEIRRPGSRP